MKTGAAKRPFSPETAARKSLAQAPTPAHLPDTEKRNQPCEQYRRPSGKRWYVRRRQDPKYGLESSDVAPGALGARLAALIDAVHRRSRADREVSGAYGRA